MPSLQRELDWLRGCNKNELSNRKRLLREAATRLVLISVFSRRLLQSVLQQAGLLHGKWNLLVQVHMGDLLPT